MRDQWRWQIHSVVVGLVLSSLYPLPIVDLELTIRFFPLLLFPLRGPPENARNNAVSIEDANDTPPMLPAAAPFQNQKRSFLGRLCVFDSATGISSANNACPISGQIDVRGMFSCRSAVQYQAIQNQNHGAVGTDVGAPLRRSTADD
ncbi:hypothetical protein BJV77DRAFT_312510 [Russula vinacea]|nr:hypothetical protein BJV77DRAFT_312510 [Russula vinacea]